MNSISIGLGIPNQPGSLVFAIDALGRALIPFGLPVGASSVGMARVAVSDLVTELGEMPSPARLRDALVSALEDPTLRLGYWSESEGLYRAADGSVVIVHPRRRTRQSRTSSMTGLRLPSSRTMRRWRRTRDWWPLSGPRCAWLWRTSA